MRTDGQPGRTTAASRGQLAIPALMEREQALKNSNPQAPPLELEVRESHADKPFSIEVPGQPEKSLN